MAGEICKEQKKGRVIVKPENLSVILSVFSHGLYFLICFCENEFLAQNSQFCCYQFDH